MNLRRKVPSLNALRFFEAAARRLSLTQAADELCVTQGAVSQRIKALEAELGYKLFRRTPAGLVLTHEGARLASGVRDGLERIEAAWNGEAATRPLRLSVLPSFAACWLVPRLGRLSERCPSARVELLAQSAAVDLQQEGVDLAIRFGLGRYPGLTSRPMMGDSVVPVAAPSLLERYPPPQVPADLARVPILYDAPTEHDASGTDWASWLEQVGCPDVAFRPGPRFSQADLVIEAAARGLGVALARVSLAAEHLASGRLVRLNLQAVPTSYSYHLVWRAEASAHTEEVRSWLMAEAATAPCTSACH